MLDNNFVYGTLRPDIYPGFKLKFPGVSYFPAILPFHKLAYGKYPFLIPTPEENNKVDGYLLTTTCNKVLLSQIDIIENYYTREKKEILVPGFSSTFAWVYNIPLPHDIN